MGSTKKDLEIIYNLQWKNSNGTVHDDKSNVVGMYDIPATTLNWETFKSYLLKNSGALVDDVKVSYISADDKEFPIESQLDFQLALYCFRQRARNNDVITLKLERINDKEAFGIKRQRLIDQVAAPPCDKVPAWFKTFMTEYKKEIVDEVTVSVISAMSTVKQPAGSRKKENTTKRTRKLVENNEKEIRKTLKLERKLEELEEKTNKIKEKKLALSRRPVGLAANDPEMLMGATPVGQAEVTVPRMSGGGIYQQEWVVTNSGSLPWTSDTELRYAWGSEALKPVECAVSCPLLKPGEKGSVVVFLEVPDVAGDYECYWHFCHNGRRFGHWLGCHISVDASPIKMLSVHRFDPVDKTITVEPPSAVSWSSQSEKPLNLSKESEATISSVAATLEDLTLACSDSDNQSVVSIADSNSSVHTTRSDEFVVVPIEVEPAAMEPAENKSGYAYISLDGKKQAVPKVFLRKDYLETAEEASTPAEAENIDAEKSRLFVFPLNCPGFEVVYPPNPMSESLIAKANPEVEETEVKVEPKPEPEPQPEPQKETCPRMTVTSSTFTTAPSMFLPGPVPIFPNVQAPPPPITIPVPPSTIHVPPPTIHIPPPPTIHVPPPPTIHGPPPPFTCPNMYPTNAPNNHNSTWFYNAYPTNPPLNATSPPFVPPYRCAYVQPNDPFSSSFMYASSEGYCSPPPPPPTQPPHFENEEPPVNPIVGPPPAVHVIPDAIVSGAVNVASSAINTARSVLNMFASAPAHSQSTSQVLQPQQPEQGTQTDPLTPRDKALKILNEMGFWDRDVNIRLLERFHNDIGRVVAELVN